jgi:hypothetical protein
LHRSKSKFNNGPFVIYCQSKFLGFLRNVQIFLQRRGTTACQANIVNFLCGKLYIPKCTAHKVLTYVEYRAVSGVFQNIDPPPPLSLHPSCVLPPHCQAVRGQYFGRRQTLDWPLRKIPLWYSSPPSLSFEIMMGERTRYHAN